MRANYSSRVRLRQSEFFVSVAEYNRRQQFIAKFGVIEIHLSAQSQSSVISIMRWNELVKILNHVIGDCTVASELRVSVAGLDSDSLPTLCQTVRNQINLYLCRQENLHGKLVSEHQSIELTLDHIRAQLQACQAQVVENCYIFMSHGAELCRIEFDGLNYTISVQQLMQQIAERFPNANQERIQSHLTDLVKLSAENIKQDLKAKIDVRLSAEVFLGKAKKIVGTLNRQLESYSLYKAALFSDSATKTTRTICQLVPHFNRLALLVEKYKATEELNLFTAVKDLYETLVTHMREYSARRSEDTQAGYNSLKHELECCLTSFVQKDYQYEFDPEQIALPVNHPKIRM